VLDKLHSTGGGILLFAVDVIVGKLAGGNWPANGTEFSRSELLAPSSRPVSHSNEPGEQPQAPEALANDYVIEITA
jgi:hypothetical protein